MAKVKASFFKILVERIKAEVRDVFICTDRQGLYLLAMDPYCTNFLADAFIGPQCFEGYECEDLVAMFINIDRLCAILKFAADDDSIHLKTDGNRNIISFTFKGVYGNLTMALKLKRKMVLGFPLNDGIVEMPSTEFDSICKKLASFDRVKISVSGGVVEFSPAGTKCPIMKLQPKDTKVTVVQQQPVSRSIELRFMKAITEVTEGTGLIGKVEINFSPEQSFLFKHIVFKHVFDCDCGYVRIYVPAQEEQQVEEQVEEQVQLQEEAQKELREKLKRREKLMKKQRKKLRMKRRKKQWKSWY